MLTCLVAEHDEKSVANMAAHNILDNFLPIQNCQIRHPVDIRTANIVFLFENAKRLDDPPHSDSKFDAADRYNIYSVVRPAVG